jgi:hypothetical protein
MRPETFKTVSVIDDKLDTSAIYAKDMLEFVKKRDFALVDGKWNPSDKPTIFHVREIPHEYMERYVLAVAGGDEESYPEKCRRAFECGVVAAENVVGDDGVCYDWKPVGKRDKNSTMTEEESRRFSGHERAEIGAVALAHSFLHRKNALSCPLPSFVRDLLGHRTCRPVDPSPSTAPVPSSETLLPATVEALPTPA